MTFDAHATFQSKCSDCDVRRETIDVHYMNVNEWGFGDLYMRYIFNSVSQ